MNARFLRFIVVVTFAVLAGCLGLAAPAEAQLGALVSPGKLAAAHASLEGLANCSKCHEQGRRVTAQKCLACHAPIAERIARKTGVHRSVTTDCVSCHADHAGVDGQLRPFDQKNFDHTTNTRFPLDGRHANLRTQCSACHKTASFLTASTSCASCHTDVHKGTLGGDCQSCHSTASAFKAVGTSFDHRRAAFALTGAHRTVACASCHVNNVFKGVKFASCTDCHKDPHKPAMGSACTACHTSETWRTRTVNHAQTAFPLVGRHAAVACAACHKQPATRVKPPSATCAVCHADPHRGSFKQDCRACHSERGFDRAPFDHATTTFRLTGRHEQLTCESCHRPAAASAAVPAPVPAARGGRGVRPAARPATTDFRGLATACVSCHADIHRAELGTACDSCHSSTTFQVASYRHRRTPEFFAGLHAPVACVKCHAPQVPTAPVRSAAPLRVSFTAASTACVSCHRDVHLGQEGDACQSCHAIDQARFVVPAFAHSGFALSGRHQSAACAACHKPETGVFPAGVGTAIRFKGVGRDCSSCHRDVHLGQVGPQCERCHTDTTFTIASYTHTGRAVAGFFTGKHVKATCEACHKPAAGVFPAGTGTAIRLTVGTACVSCHADVHRGALGRDCGSCHRP